VQGLGELTGDRARQARDGIVRATERVRVVDPGAGAEALLNVLVLRLGSWGTVVLKLALSRKGPSSRAISTVLASITRRPLASGAGILH
jgi:hypothetical protein